VFYVFKVIILDILTKVSREDTANGAIAFVCGDTNEKCQVVSMIQG